MFRHSKNFVKVRERLQSCINIEKRQVRHEAWGTIIYSSSLIKYVSVRELHIKDILRKSSQQLLLLSKSIEQKK